MATRDSNRMLRFVSVMSALGALMCSAGIARAEDPQLQRAVRHYEEQDYKKALGMLDRALGKAGLGKADRLEALRYRGFVHVALGHDDKAADDFRELLKLDPGLELNPLLTSPKILEAFNKVRDEMRRRSRVLLQHTPPGDLQASERVELKAYAVDLESRVDRLQLFYRRRGEPNYSSTSMQAEASTGSRGARTYTGFIPLLWETHGEVELEIEYYLAALDRHKATLAHAGEPKTPLVIRVGLAVAEPSKARTDDGEQPVWKAWWLWTAVAVGVAGLAVGGYFLADHLADNGQVAPMGGAILVIH
ncbi:MAG: tetratricopeptide repeat protein [Deltaproteobacteria bacterium]|nr:tetratricopeptide repeat protein [Deltaproteobacteria bacterium]